MSRKSTAVLVFLVLLNGSATMFEASGVAADWGVNPQTGSGEAIQGAIDTAKQGFSPNSGFGETLFSLFAAAMKLVEGLFKAIYAAPVMFMNLGLPEWFVLPLFAPMYIVSVLDIVYVGTGRSL